MFKTLLSSILLSALPALLAAVEKPPPPPDAARIAVVAADGSGDFTSVQEAVDAVPPGHLLLHLIRIEPGTYREVVTVPRDKGPLKFLGTDPEKTVLTFDHNATSLDAEGKEIGTFRSASVFIEADNFVAENITFANSFGKGSQALAIHVSGDRVTFRNCRFLGWQDTVLLNGGRQYFDRCHIEGVVDFIFGRSTAYFDQCEIRCLDAGYITAASTDEDLRHGFVFSHCRITAEPGDWQTYLGRPWRPYASVTYLHTEMPENIRPAGWDNWRNPENEKTARFSEFASTGPGAPSGERVSWARTLSELEARSMTRQRVLNFWDPRHVLSAERVAVLPDARRREWEGYLLRSAAFLQADKAALAGEVKAAGLEAPVQAPDGRDFNLPKADPGRVWFGSPETRELADTVISYQVPSGGWSKHVDYSRGPRMPGTRWSSQGDSWHYVGTIDNRSTTEQLRLLAGVTSASGRSDAKEAFYRGLDYLFNAQYPNGGWPQVYPLEAGYHSNVTFNDDAMVNVLKLMRDIAHREPNFDFVDRDRRDQAGMAFRRGIDCVLAAQFVQDGRPTVWGAQHDPITLEPVAARRQEPASLSGGESVAIVRLLMEFSNPSPEIGQAIEHALAWFDKSRITGMRRTKEGRGLNYVSDPTATGPLWARFYDLKTNNPLFAGGQDGLIYASFSEMAEHNGVGYAYYTQRPQDLLTKLQEEWRERVGRK